MFAEMMKQLKMIKLVIMKLRSVHGSVSLWITRNFGDVMEKLFPGKSLAKDAISHCGDSSEVKLVTAVDELKVPDCGNETE